MRAKREYCDLNTSHVNFDTSNVLVLLFSIKLHRPELFSILSGKFSKAET